jgi:hypothetical protein
MNTAHGRRIAFTPAVVVVGGVLRDLQFVAPHVHGGHGRVVEMASDIDLYRGRHGVHIVPLLDHLTVHHVPPLIREGEELALGRDRNGTKTEREPERAERNGLSHAGKCSLPERPTTALRHRLCVPGIRLRSQDDHPHSPDDMPGDPSIGFQANQGSTTLRSHYPAKFAAQQCRRRSFLQRPPC